jgi:proline dehydrogenase
VRRFLPGESAEDALDAARELERRGMSSVLTRLGENVADAEEAQEEVDHYVRVLEETSRAGLDAEISVKLTHLGLDLDRSMAREHLAVLAERAADHGSFVWVDMESSDYTEVTLQIFREVRSGHPEVGVCVQSYLHRTPDDVDALLEEGASLRLVKGAYDEPPSEALQEKDAVDDAFRSLGRRMLDAARDGGPRQTFGTHDLSILSDLRRAAREMEVDEERYELQMLYGIRNRELEAMAAGGHRCRVLISYGEEWFPWYMRRLAERPANLAFVLRNLFRR